ncbi:hypothetical protein F7725_020337 [Dissostichus mawsoni]|uniref:Uncharacterized protein n=1 Tax=Dissostichus mawsoni TaxID=36200 RepID=A0A7J5YEX6_DISMA|nr:hypothetical protein F7725_020337 [Dissostichus mawsoni]
MNLFQTLQEDGHFTGDFLDKSLIQFCYLNLVQQPQPPSRQVEVMSESFLRHVFPQNQTKIN